VSEEVVPFFSLFRRTSLAFQTRPLPPTWLTARVVLKAAERPGRLDPGRI